MKKQFHKYNNISIIGSRGIPNNYGGFEKFTEILSTALVKKDVHVLVSCEKNRDLNMIDEYCGVKLFFFPLNPPSKGYLRNLYEFVYDAYSLYVASRKSDVVYMLGYSAAFLFFIPKLFGKTLWVNPDGIEWKRNKFNILIKGLLKVTEKLAFFWADEIIADSIEIKKYIKFTHNHDSHFIAYGVGDIPEIVWDTKKLPDILKGVINENSSYWLAVARLEPENNIHLIIDAYLKSKVDIPLIIIGNFASDKYEEKIKNRLIKSSKNIIFTGGIYDQLTLNMLRQNCFAYIHGHSVGGTNPSLLEIMSMKKVILAHGNAFNKEVCGDTAIYFNDVNELQEKMEAITEKMENFVQLQNESYNRVKEEYSWNKIVDSYLKLINDNYLKG